MPTPKKLKIHALKNGHSASRTKPLIIPIKINFPEFTANVRIVGVCRYSLVPRSQLSKRWINLRPISECLDVLRRDSGYQFL